MLDSRRAGRLEAQVAQLYTDLFPNEPTPSNPVAAMRNAGIEARDRADFLGIYGGNRSALDLMAELSRRVPREPRGEVRGGQHRSPRHPDQGVRKELRGGRSTDRTELAASEPFGLAKVDGEVKASRKRTGEGLSP